MFGEGSRIAFNGMYNRTADNEARVETGHFENEGIDAKITRMDYVQRAVSSAQLDRRARIRKPPLRLGGDGERCASRRARPVGVRPGCRRREPTAGQSFAGLARATAARFAPSRRSTSIASKGKGDYQWGFNAFGREHSLKIGGLGRQTTRNSRRARLLDQRAGCRRQRDAARSRADLRRPVPPRGRQRVHHRTARAGRIVRRARQARRRIHHDGNRPVVARATDRRSAVRARPPHGERAVDARITALDSQRTGTTSCRRSR